jgi:hypothetical protein
MSRRKKEEPRVSHERWLVSYADFVTLLFAFFVVLYASSQVDKRRVGRLALAIQVAFQELGVFETSNTHIPLSDTEAIPFSNVQAVENVTRTSELDRIVEPMKGILAPVNSPAPLKDIQAELEKAAQPPCVLPLFRPSIALPPLSCRAPKISALKVTPTTFPSTIRIFLPTGNFPPRVQPNSSASLSFATMLSPIASPPPASPNSIPSTSMTLRKAAPAIAAWTS